MAIINSVWIDEIRTIASGSKTFSAGLQKYLEIDSGTNHAEILSININGVAANAIVKKWKLEIYIPTVDGVSAPDHNDKRDEYIWDNAEEAGLIPGPIGIPYNMFLDFTNNATSSKDIDEVIVVYRSSSTLTLTWEAAAD